MEERPKTGLRGGRSTQKKVPFQGQMITVHARGGRSIRKQPPFIKPTQSLSKNVQKAYGNSCRVHKHGVLRNNMRVNGGTINAIDGLGAELRNLVNGEPRRPRLTRHLGGRIPQANGGDEVHLLLAVHLLVLVNRDADRRNPE